MASQDGSTHFPLSVCLMLLGAATEPPPVTFDHYYEMHDMVPGAREPDYQGLCKTACDIFGYSRRKYYACFYYDIEGRMALNPATWHSGDWRLLADPEEYCFYLFVRFRRHSQPEYP